METTPPSFNPQETAVPQKRRISFQYVIDAFLRSVDRFPVTLCYVLAFIVWGVTDCWISDSFVKAPQTVQNLQPALWFLTGNGILLTLAVSLWCEQTRRQSWCNKIQIAANLLLVADFINIILHFNSFSDSVWVGRMAIETALIVSVIFVPVLKSASKRHCLMFSFSQTCNLIIAGLISDVIGIAVMIIYSTVTLLFGIHYEFEFFLSLIIIFPVGLGILIFLGTIPTYERVAELAASYQPKRFLINVIRYILLPLTAIYMVILYCYGLKIIVTGVFPKGEICYMVTALTAAVYLLLFVLKATSPQGSEDRFTKISLRIFPIALIPLLVMMSVAIGQRIDQYGMSVARLYVLTFNIWAYLSAIYLFVSRSRNTNIVALSFAVLFLLTSVIPGMNYTSMVQEYMRGKVITLLECAGFDRSEMPLTHAQFEEARDKMDAEDWRDVTSKLRYLDDRDDHSLVSDIADFKIQTGYYDYDPLFADPEDADGVVIEEVEPLPVLYFGDDKRMVEIPEGYRHVRYYSTAKYGIETDSNHILAFPVTSGIRIRLDMDSIRTLDQKVNHKPLVRSIEGIPADSSIFVVSKIDYFINDENYTENKKVNNITVNGYQFTR